MQNHDSAFAPVSSIQLFGNSLSTVDLILILVGMVAAIAAFYLAVQFILKQPYLLPIGSITAIVAGVATMITGDAAKGIPIAIIGVAVMFFCALTYSRNNQVARGK